MGDDENLVFDKWKLFLPSKCVHTRTHTHTPLALILTFLLLLPFLCAQTAETNFLHISLYLPPPRELRSHFLPAAKDHKSKNTNG